MKKIIYGILSLGLIGLLVIGCSKDKINQSVFESQKSNFISEHIPYFENSNMLMQKIQRMEKLDDETRQIEENNSGNKSLYTLIYELYEEVNIEELNSIEELKDHISKYPDFLKIKDNEQEYYPVYSENPYSIIAGTNRLFQVNEFYFKVFDDGLLISDKENINDLKSIKESKIQNLKRTNNSFGTVLFKENVMAKATCDPYLNIERTTNNKERTKLKASSSYTNDYNNVNNYPYSVISSFVRIRPYKKTLGVWYHCQRTISGHVKYTVKYTVAGVSEIQSYSENTSVSPQKKFSVTITNGIGLPAHTTSMGFISIDSWGKTPSTSIVEIKCN